MMVSAFLFNKFLSFSGLAGSLQAGQSKADK